MKTTRYIIQYQDTLDRWADNDNTYTEEEARAVLAAKKADTSTIPWRVIERTIETTEKEIA